MFQRHLTATPRVARMIRELEGADTAQIRAGDVAKPATDRGRHPLRHTAHHWFKAAAVLIAAGFVAVVAWQVRAVEMTEGALTATGAGTDVAHVPLQVIVTP